MAVPKPMLTEFGIHYSLESCGGNSERWYATQIRSIYVIRWLICRRPRTYYCSSTPSKEKNKENRFQLRFFLKTIRLLRLRMSTCNQRIFSQSFLWKSLSISLMKVLVGILNTSKRQLRPLFGLKIHVQSSCSSDDSLQRAQANLEEGSSWPLEAKYRKSTPTILISFSPCCVISSCDDNIGDQLLLKVETLFHVLF